MPIDVDGLSWSSLASAGGGSLNREGVRAEMYFDRALVTRAGIKFYTSPTTAIIQGRIEEANDTSTTTFLRMATNDLVTSVGNAYPALYSEIQIYNLTADPLEQVNLYGEMPLQALHAVVTGS